MPSEAVLATRDGGLGKPAEAFLHGARPVSDLINSPDLYSVVVAVVAGIVGALAMRGQRLIWRRWLRVRGEPD